MRQLEYKPLDDLEADPRNPKAHDVDTVTASVGRFGYVEPIVLDGRTGFIVSGHGRTKALKQMRLNGETPPEGVSPDWEVPVITGWSSRTDAEAAAALIALNRTTELGGWVDETLLELLDGLTDLDGVGYTEAEIDKLRAYLDQIDLDEDDTLGDEVDDVYDTDTGAVTYNVDIDADAEPELYEALGNLPFVQDIRRSR